VGAGEEGLKKEEQASRLSFSIKPNDSPAFDSDCKPPIAKQSGYWV
jgi:hypothetical protein